MDNAPYLVQPLHACAAGPVWNPCDRTKEKRLSHEEKGASKLAHP